jgi:hypothetical protein
MPAVKHWLEYTNDWRSEPMAYWVHIEQDGKHWRNSRAYAPPAPQRVPHKGFAVVCVEASGTVLRFSSEAQIEEFIRVLAMKPLPTSRRMSAMRGTGAGPNQHWLSRLPVALKSSRARPRLVELLKQVLALKEAPNPSIEGTSQRPLRVLCAAPHVKR